MYVQRWSGANTLPLPGSRPVAIATVRGTPVAHLRRGAALDFLDRAMGRFMFWRPGGRGRIAHVVINYVELRHHISFRVYTFSCTCFTKLISKKVQVTLDMYINCPSVLSLVYSVGKLHKHSTGQRPRPLLYGNHQFLVAPLLILPVHLRQSITSS